MPTESQFEKYLDPKLLAELRRIQLRTRRSISSDLIGQYRSAFRGSGLVFSELREYQPGDDVKHINWKVSARSDKVFVKSYEEERQLNIVVALDISRSTLFGSRSKHDKALEFAALISILAHQSRDAVGLCLFSKEIEVYLPTSPKRSQLYRILSELLVQRELMPETNLAAALSHLSSHQRKRSFIFIVSDFYSPSYEKELKELAYRHEVVCVLLEDLLDSELPAVGMVEFIGAESGERIVLDCSSKASRSALRNMHNSRIRSVQDLCEKAGCDFIRVNESALAPLAALMRRRTARQR